MIGDDRLCHKRPTGSACARGRAECVCRRNACCGRITAVVPTAFTMLSWS